MSTLFFRELGQQKTVSVRLHPNAEARLLRGSDQHPIQQVVPPMPRRVRGRATAARMAAVSVQIWDHIDAVRSEALLNRIGERVRVCEVAYGSGGR